MDFGHTILDLAVKGSIPLGFFTLSVYPHLSCPSLKFRKKQCPPPYAPDLRLFRRLLLFKGSLRVQERRKTNEPPLELHFCAPPSTVNSPSHGNAENVTRVWRKQVFFYIKFALFSI